MKPGIVVRHFGYKDVPHALKLSDLAGWNQIADDWHRIVDLAPNGCLGAWSGDDLVGTTTFVTYGGMVAWIGMVLVHPDFRRRGIGRRLFEGTMATLLASEMRVIGLDATEFGRPLYRSAGFVDLVPIVRWQGILNPVVYGASGGKMYGRRGSRLIFDSVRQVRVLNTVRDEILDQLISLDRDYSGLDRRFLLEHLLGEEGAHVLVLEEGSGYGVLRPGRSFWQFGPVVVQELGHAVDLLVAASHLLDGKELIIDSVERADFGEMFRNAGLKPQRRLTRMTYDRPLHVLTNQHTVGATCFAWG